MCVMHANEYLISYSYHCATCTAVICVYFCSR